MPYQLTTKLGDCRFQTQEMPVHCNTDSVRFDGSARAGSYFPANLFPLRFVNALTNEFLVVFHSSSTLEGS